MLSRFSLATKMMLTFMAIIFLTVILAVFAVIQNNRLSTVTNQIASSTLPSLHAVTAVDAALGKHRRGEILMFVALDQEAKAKYFKRNDEAEGELKKEMAAYEKLIVADEERKDFGDFKKAIELYLSEYPKLKELALRVGVDAEASQTILGTSSKTFNEAIAAIEKLKKIDVERSGLESKDAYSITQATRIWTLVLVCFCVVIGLVLIINFSRAVSRPLKKLAADAELVASGDLGVVVEVGSEDEIGNLARSFEKMVNNLREMIGTLADSSSHISTSSDEMYTNAERVLDGAEDVASQSITVATASEEMSATSADIAQNCQLAAESAKRAHQAAERGGVVVEKSISVMNRIAERVQSSAATVESLGKRSDAIGAIAGTIEDIADQTNLLALNAAIEAARAGEQGRGFAVVADEVRALAERTTKATHEISQMIKAIQEETSQAVVTMQEGVAEVEQGTGEAARSGEALLMIQEEINAVNLQVQQIATAAEEQTATTSEISGSMHQITNVAQNTVAMTRNTAAAAQHMARLSDALQKVVSQFKLSDTGNFIDWSSSYSVGIEQMDNEHKRLIGIINNLYQAMRSGRSHDAVGSILDDLIDYTKTHFAHEERLMGEASFTELDQQKRAHEALVKQVVGIQEKFHSGTALGQEIMSFLKDWLVNHIQGMDKKYGPVMKKKGIK